MTCLGWPSTTLAKAPQPAVVGREVTNGEGRVQEGEKREQFTPPLSSQTKQQRILDVRTVNLIQVGFRQPHPIQSQHIFVCQLTSQVPMSAPSWVCMMLRAPHHHPPQHPNHHEETPQKLIGPFNIIVTCSTVKSVLLALLSAGL